MEPCVYATQFSMWLEAAVKREQTDLVCFRSNKRWSTAEKLLKKHGNLPILIRQQDESLEKLRCRFVATLVEVHFRNQFPDDKTREDWLEEKLWLQRATIKADPLPKYSGWEEQYREWEIDNFMRAETWYVVQNVRQIRPLPLPRLRKLVDDQPLAENYIRGYALCHYPTVGIEVVDHLAKN